MNRVIWIGREPVPEVLRQALASREIFEFTSAEDALRAIAALPIEVGIVSADVEESATTIQVLLAARPELQILAATHQGVPARLDLALRSGAAGLIDLGGDSPRIDRQVHEASIAHARAAGERELLLRLRTLNEEFLRNVVSMEKRNIELTERLEESARLASETFTLGPTNEPPRERVLVVDDEETICDLVMLTLQEKYEVKTVLDGEHGVAELKSRPYHLVITDKNLPVMSGLDVMRAAKASNPETDVIMMTGYSSKESAIEALNLGASAYLEKPFDLTVMSEKVEQVLNKQRERLKKRHYLQLIKERNRSFLQQYGAIRTDLESWLALRGVPIASRAKPG